jgi:hypothetical protein
VRAGGEVREMHDECDGEEECDMHAECDVHDECAMREECDVQEQQPDGYRTRRSLSPLPTPTNTCLY